MKGQVYKNHEESAAAVKEHCERAIYKNFHYREDIEHCELLTLLVLRMRLFEWSTFKLTSKHHLDTINRFFKIRAKKFAELAIRVNEIVGIPIEHLEFVKTCADEHFRKSEYDLAHSKYGTVIAVKEELMY